MNRILLKTMLLSALLALSASTAAAQASGQPRNVVEMTDALNYAPSTITIDAGDSIVWRNTSSLVHTVTADPDRANDPSHVRLPDGAEPFHSGEIAPGGQYQRRFDVAGRYRYFCVPHEAAGMVGEIEVR